MILSLFMMTQKRNTSQVVDCFVLTACYLGKVWGLWGVPVGKRVESVGYCVNFSAPFLSTALLCGLSIPSPVWSSGNTMLIRFESDGENSYRGFKARIAFFPSGWQGNAVHNL